MVVRCHWCGSGFALVNGSYWCRTAACRARQAAHSVSVESTTDGSTVFLYVPLPRQVEFDACMARYLLGGGSAGSTKSHSARWSMYRRALAIPEYEGLILRETWDELNKHHFRLMDREAHIFQKYGFDVNFSITNRQMTFKHPDGSMSIIEGGHMEDPKDVRKYLSRERDEIVCDEGSLIQPRPLLELSTRARSSKPQVRAAGFRGLFRVYTNPGGPSSSILRDLFIDHSPDWDQFPAKFRDDYDPAEWVYIPGMLEDNPYLDENYERDLSLLEPWRYEQLRHNNWDVVAGLFFSEFKGRDPWVQDLGDPGDDVEWFRSMDWGYVAPGCFLWWACLPDGILYVRREYKYSHLPIPVVAAEVRKMTKDMRISRVRYTQADPSIFSTYGGSTEAKGETIAETFMRPPNRLPLFKADNNRESGWQRIRELLRLRSDGRPTLIIHPDCRYLIRTLAAAVSSRTNPEDVDTNIDDHAIDALRYGAMSRPSPTRVTSQSSNRTFNAYQKRIVAARRAHSVR